jgi:hypothetical protein
MEIDQSTIENAVHYLLDGKEAEAARVLRDCTLESWEVVDYWMDGSRQLDGLLLEVACPRSAFEVLTRHDHPLTISIGKALRAVLPGGTYLKSLSARRCPQRAVCKGSNLGSRMPT